MNLPRATWLAVLCAGMVLLLGQLVLARAVASCLFSTELVLLATTAVTLLAPALGVAAFPSLSPAARRRACAVAACVAPCVPWLPRAVLVLTRSPLAVALALALTACVTFGAWALVLPTLLPRDDDASRPRALGTLYALELTGALAALAALHVFGYAFATRAWQLSGVGLMRTTGRIPRALAVVVVALTLAGPTLEAAASRAYFKRVHGHADPRVVLVRDSPLQRIEVVDDGPSRALYLDGVAFFRAGDLSQFDVVLAELPGRAQLQRGRALVVGSGSFMSSSHLVALGYDVTVVEVDRAVAEVGFSHFSGWHRLTPANIHLVIDDARRWLRANPGARFDLIVMDVPAPYHLHTALLHTREFYALLRAHLAPGGLASLSACDALDSPMGGAVTAAAHAAFEHVMAVEANSVGFPVLYASREALPDAQTVVDLLTALDPAGGDVFREPSVREYALRAKPLSYASLAVVFSFARSAWEAP